MKRIALILMLMTPTWAWAGNYLCISKQATGFLFENDKWNNASFTEEKFIVKIENNMITVSRFGSQFPIYSNSECNYYEGDVECSTISGQFKLRTNNLRFLRTYTHGYVEDTGPDDTPLIRIGTCSKF